MSTVKNVSEIAYLDPTNKEIPGLVKAIDDSLYLYEEPMMQWLTKHTFLMRPKVNQIHPQLYEDLFTLVEKLSYTAFRDIDQINLQYLIILSNEIIRGTKYTSEIDQGLRILLLRLKANFRSSKNLVGNSGT